MQGAMWLGSQNNPFKQPEAGDFQLTDVFSVFHLMVDGEKMSKSRGNFYSADQLIDEMGYDADQIRYFLCTLGLAEKPSNFDFNTFNERNKFLAGPMNAAIEKPISAVHTRFEGKIPAGKLIEKIEGYIGPDGGFAELETETLRYINGMVIWIRKRQEHDRQN
jgi:methionyl-tRNA synthetase